MNRIVSVALIGWAPFSFFLFSFSFSFFLFFHVLGGPFCVLQWERSIGL